MREFYQLFARGLDSKGEAKGSDANDAFVYMGGDPRDKESRIDTERVHQTLLDDFDLDVTLEDVFGVSGTQLSREQLDRLLHAEAKTKTPPTSKTEG